MGKREENARKKKIKRIAVKTVAWFILIATITFFLIAVISKKDLFIWIWFGCDILFLVWFAFFAQYFEPNTKAYKFALDFKNFDSVIEYLDNNIYKIGFKRYYNFDVKKAIVYYKLNSSTLSYFFIIKQDKILSNKRDTFHLLDDIKEEFIEIFYQELFDKEKKFNYFEENYFFIVDEENDVFKKIMDTNVFGEYKQPYIFTGYSFKTNCFYVAQQKEGYYLNYRWLRNKVLKVMNLKMKDRIRG